MGRRELTLREHVRVGDTLDVSSPRGSFILDSGERPVVLLSAGIGATPLLAMLYALATARSTRRVLWLHAARDGEHHPSPAKCATSCTRSAGPQLRLLQQAGLARQNRRGF
jgi:ferredoxin-NADP reductase